MSSVHRWDDNRVFKEAGSLAKHYRVDLCAVGEFRYRRVKEVDVYGLPDYKKRLGRMFNWLRLFRHVLKARACVCHFHDPELIPLGLILKLLGRKVVYDVHEDYRDAILHKYWIPGWARKAVAVIFDFLEKRCGNFFDALIFAEITYKQSFPRGKALREDILNFPLPVSRCRQVDKNRGRGVNLIYSGGISEIRGAEQMVRVVSRLAGEGIDIHLFLVGNFLPPELEIKLKRMINGLQLEDCVTLTGRIPPAELHYYYSRADIGLALLHPIENYLKSEATKIFEYMSAGIPVVASDFPRWRELLQDTGAGLTVNPFDIRAIAEKIKYLIDNPHLRLGMGRNGYRAHKERFNWTGEEIKLLHLYERLLQEEAGVTDSNQWR